MIMWNQFSKTKRRTCRLGFSKHKKTQFFKNKMAPLWRRFFENKMGPLWPWFFQKQDGARFSKNKMHGAHVDPVFQKQDGANTCFDVTFSEVLSKSPSIVWIFLPKSLKICDKSG